MKVGVDQGHIDPLSFCRSALDTAGGSSDRSNELSSFGPTNRGRSSLTVKLSVPNALNWNSSGRGSSQRLTTLNSSSRAHRFRTATSRQRLIGSIRREYLYSLIVFGEAKLRRLLKNHASDAALIVEDCDGVSAPAEARLHRSDSDYRRTLSDTSGFRFSLSTTGDAGEIT
jgi:hypothetical protein